MTIFIFVLTVIAIAHFVYESIVAPSLRMHLRNQLFELRDEIRSIRAQGVASEDEEAFWYTHDGINNLLDRLSWLTLQARVSSMITYKEDSKLRALVQARKEMLDNCKDVRIKETFLKTSAVLENAFNVNMGAWAFYLLPIAVVAGTIGNLHKLASNLLLTPEKQREAMLPRPVLAG